jgi:membrane protein implicated in regulation of membrane protease activity
MTDNAVPIATLLELAKDYSNSTLELFKLSVIDKSADVVSSLVSRLAIFLTVALSLLIINIGIALWVGKLLGDSFYGFLVIGGFYAILSVLLYVYRHQWIKIPVSNSIIKQMLKQHDIPMIQKSETTNHYHVAIPPDN